MSESRPIVLLFLIPALLWLTTACDSHRFYEENKSIPDGVWKSNEPVGFDVTVSDTLSRYNFFLNLRNAGDYPYSNLYLFIRTIPPGGTAMQDTMECQLAGDDGKWLGKGMGSLKFTRFFFQENVRLAKAGVYRFEIEQAMRTNELKGIHDIGIRIEKATR